MTEYTLWSDNPTPATTDASDGGASGVVTATGCLFAAGGAIVAVRFRATDTVNSSETYTVAVWDTGTTKLLVSKTVSGSTITAGAWNRVDLDYPLPVDSTHAYVVGLRQSAGRYVATASYFNSNDEGSLSNVYAWGDHDDISAIVAGQTDARNGQSRVNTATVDFPNNFTGAGYFVTPVWDDAPSEITLWSATEVPSQTNQSDGGASGITTATGCLFGAGYVKGVWFRATDTVSGNYTIGLWRMTSASTGTLLASKDFTSGDITAGQWNRVEFDTPVAVADDEAYRVGVWSSAGRYCATSNYWTTSRGSLANVYGWDDNEDISSVVPSLSTVDNGTFLDNAAFGFPQFEFNAGCYFVSPIWSASAGGTTYPVTLNPTAVASATSLSVQAVRAAAPGPVVVTSGSSASVHAVRRVTLSPVVVTSGTSLRFTAPAYTRRGGVLVQTTLRGAVKRAGQSLAFG